MEKIWFTAIAVLGFAGVSVCSIPTYGAKSEEQRLVHHDYLPGTFVLLGQGFSISDPMNPTPPCVQGVSAIPSPGSATSQSTTFDEKVAVTSRGLKRVLGIDTSMDASVLTYSARGQFEFNDESDLSENDVYVVVSGRAEFGTEVMDLSRLEYVPFARSLIDAGKMDEFRSLCGGALISEVNHGVYVSAVITIHDLSENEKRDMGLAVSGSGGFGPLTASASVKVSEAMSDSSVSDRMSLQVYVRGGNGLPDLATLVEKLKGQGQTIADLQAGISGLLQTLGAQRASVTGFTTMPYPGLSSERGDLMSGLKTEKLTDLVDAYRFQDGRYASLKPALLSYEQAGEIPEGYGAATPMVFDEAISDLPNVEGYLQRLAKAHRACMEDQTGGLSACAIPPAPFFRGFNLLYRMREKSRTQAL